MIRKTSFAIYTLGALLLVSVALNIFLWRVWGWSVDVAQGQLLNGSLVRSRQLTRVQRHLYNGDADKAQSLLNAMALPEIRILVGFREQEHSEYSRQSATERLSEMDTDWAMAYPQVESLLDLKDEFQGLWRVVGKEHQPLNTHTEEPHQ